MSCFLQLKTGAIICVRAGDEKVIWGYNLNSPNLRIKSYLQNAFVEVVKKEDVEKALKSDNYYGQIDTGKNFYPSLTSSRLSYIKSAVTNWDYAKVGEW